MLSLWSFDSEWKIDASKKLGGMKNWSLKCVKFVVGWQQRGEGKRVMGWTFDDIGGHWEDLEEFEEV